MPIVELHHLGSTRAAGRVLGNLSCSRPQLLCKLQTTLVAGAAEG